MKESIISMIYRTQNRIRGLSAQDDDMSVGQKAAYIRVLAELKLLLAKCEGDEDVG